MNSIIHTYKDVYTAVIKLYSDGSCRKQDECLWHTRDTINKMACIRTDNDWDLVSSLYEEATNTSFSPGSSLYVASECKTGRDTFRNSGYSITRSPEKADAIVVPDIRREFFYKMNCNMVAYHPEKELLYLFNIDKPGYLSSSLTENDLMSVKKYAQENWGMEADDILRSNIDVWFLPKCDEIKDILQDNMRNVPYIQESRVPIKASTQFSPETLVFWENIEDENLLARTICTSDWADYPVTLLAFLICFKGGRNWYNYANGDFRRILKQIGYETYWNPDYAFQNNSRYITPKDYEMLQSYLMYKLGLDAKGGFVTAKQFEAIVPSALRGFVRRMIAVKPAIIPVKMKLNAVEEMAGS